MKTLKDFLNERQLGPMVVKNPDEQKFIDKHVVAKTADRNGNGDDVFKAANVKKVDRKKERHGYEPGEDEAVYEELKGGQKKLDKNHNGKLDSQDFKLLRKKKVAEEADYLETDLKKRKKNNDKAIKDMKKMGSPMRNPAFGEEAEQIDELSRKTLGSYIKKAQGTVVTNTAAMVDSDSDLDRKTNAARKVGNRLKGVNSAVNRMTKEEAEQIDELSTATLQSYRKKARAQGNAIVDKMKMGGGDWSKDQKDTKTLRKRAAGAQASGKQLVKRGESLKTEEAEQIDELDRQLGGTLSRYINKTKDNPKREAGRNLALSKRWGDTKYGTPEPKVKAVDRFKEETELQEAHYEFDVSGEHGNKGADEFVSHAKKAGIKAKVHTYNGPGGGNPVVHLSHSDHKVVHKFIKKLYDPHMSSSDIERHRFHVKEEAEQVDEVLTAKTPMNTYIKDFQKSDAPQFKGKSKEKRRVMAIAAKLSAERGGKKLTKEEKLEGLIGDLNENHKRTLLSVFNKLSEDNQSKFIVACETEGGIEAMLDFSINNRGE